MKRNAFGLIASPVCAMVALVALADAALSQSAVSSITTREGTRGTGLTGAPAITSFQTPDNPHAWPLPSGGTGWSTVGQSFSNPYPNVSVGQTFDPEQLSQTTPPTPIYTFDRQGNEIYTDPSTGRSQVFGTSIERLK